MHFSIGCVISLISKWFFQYALLGEDLRLARDVILHIDAGVLEQIEENAPMRGVDHAFSNTLVVPAFVNAHTHLGDSVAKESAWNATLDQAVGSSGIKFQKLKERASEISKAIQQIIQNMVESGVGAFVDFREGGLKGVQLLKKLTSAYPGEAIILGRPATDNMQLDQIVNASDGLGIATTTAFSDDELENIRKKVKGMGKILAVHCAENSQERQLSISHYGQNDVLRATRILGADILIHLTKANHSDLLLVKEHRTGVVFCPRSNAYFGSGFPPVIQAIKAEIPVALGTDNVMVTHPDPLQEARWLALQLRLRGHRLNPRIILQMITTNPAKMFALQSGIIEVGRKANLLGINLKSPRTSFCEDPILALLMRATPEDYLLVNYGEKLLLSTKRGEL